MTTHEAIKWIYSIAVNEKNPNALEALQMAIDALMKIKSIQFNCYALNRLMEDFEDGKKKASPDV